MDSAMGFGLSELDVTRRAYGDVQENRFVLDVVVLTLEPWRQTRFGAEVQGGDPNAVKNLWRCHRLSA